MIDSGGQDTCLIVAELASLRAFTQSRLLRLLVGQVGFTKGCSCPSLVFGASLQSPTVMCELSKHSAKNGTTTLPIPLLLPDLTQNAASMAGYQVTRSEGNSDTTGGLA